MQTIMNQSELQAIPFLKQLRTEVEKILGDSEHIAFLAKQLYKRYNEWVEINPDISRSESFKNLEKDIVSLSHTCAFVAQDCEDVRQAIVDCDTELN